MLIKREIHYKHITYLQNVNNINFTGETLCFVKKASAEEQRLEWNQNVVKIWTVFPTQSSNVYASLA